MLEGGADVQAAALVKVMYDKVAATPAKDTPAGRRQYLKMMGLVRDAYQGVKTVADVKAAQETLFKGLKWYDGGSQDNATRDTLFSVYKGRRSPFDLGYRERKSADKLIDKGWPNARATRPKPKPADGESPARPALDKLKRVGPARREGKPRAGDVTRLSHLRAEMAQAFDGLMRAIYQRDRTQADVVREAELALEKHQADVERVRQAGARFLAQGDKVNAGHQRNWLLTHGELRLKQLERVLQRTRGLEQGAALGKTKSSYFEQAEKLAGKSGARGYWTRPTELFARAFEATVFDRLSQQNRQTDYLVHGVEAARYASANYKGNPYPVGLERQAIKQAFDGLFETMQSRETDPSTGSGGPSAGLRTGVALYSQGAFGEFSDQLLARREEVAAELRTIIGKLAPKADLKLFDSLTREVSGRQGYVAGSQVGATNNLALN